MCYPFPLTRSNRLKLASAYRDVPRVDITIDCILEDQLGQAFVDSPSQPSVYKIGLGPFWYFAGDPAGEAARALLDTLPPYCFLMPSAPGWLELAYDVFGSRLKSFPRYSFSAERLSPAHLVSLLQASPHAAHILPLDHVRAERLLAMPEPYLEVSDYGSLDDFLERSFGFTCLREGQILGMAAASLICSRCIEVSVYVEEPARRTGLATALCCRLLLESLGRGFSPHWDAANPESCKVALKLGYTYLGAYDAHYYTAG